jgi:hypothetical protein
VCVVRCVGTVARYSPTATWPAHARSKAPPAVAIRWRSDERDSWTGPTPTYARVPFARHCGSLGRVPVPLALAPGSDGHEASRPGRQGVAVAWLRRVQTETQMPGPAVAVATLGTRRRGVMCRDCWPTGWEEAARPTSTSPLVASVYAAPGSRQNHLHAKVFVRAWAVGHAHHPPRLVVVMARFLASFGRLIGAS